MYYVLLNSLDERTGLMKTLKKHGINSVFHYVPLHSAPAGLRYGRVHGKMIHTDDLSDRLLRLPLWIGLDKEKKNTLIDSVFQILELKLNSKQ